MGYGMPKRYKKNVSRERERADDDKNSKGGFYNKKLRQ